MTFEETYSNSNELRNRFRFLMEELKGKGDLEKMDHEDPFYGDFIATMKELKELEIPFLDDFSKQNILKTFYPVIVFFTKYYDFLRTTEKTDTKEYDAKMTEMMLLLANSQHEMLMIDAGELMPFSIRHGFKEDDLVDKLKSLFLEPSVKYHSVLEEIFSRNLETGSTVNPEEIKELLTRQMAKYDEILDLLATPGFDTDTSEESREALSKLYDELISIEQTDVQQIFNSMLYQTFVSVRLFEEMVYSDNVALLRGTAGPLKNRFTKMMDDMKYASEKYFTFRDEFLSTFCDRHGLDLKKALNEVFKEIDIYKNLRIISPEA